MLARYAVPLFAIAGIAIMIQTVRSQSSPSVPATAQPIAAPARSPFERTVSGSGLVEASSENIPIGAHIGGIVAEVRVKPGDRVKAGDVLFRIDARNLTAERAVRAAALDVAEAQLARLRSLPWSEDLPPARARVAEAEATVADRRADAERARLLSRSGAIAGEDLTRRENSLLAAEAVLAAARAELGRLEAGAWEADIRIAEANRDSAKAQLQAVEVELSRLEVRSPIDGEVLDTDLRVGQYAPAGPTDPPLMIVGRTELLHVRVDVDENDAWRVKPGARARAFQRGNPALAADLEFVRIEPKVIPKRSLTGFSSERVDTRVLQVLFAVRREAFPVFVGQLLDVRIEDVSSSDSPTPEAGS